MGMIKLKGLVCCVTIFGVILLSGCVPSIGERMAYWKAEVAREIPVGTTKEAVMEWGSRRDIKLTESTKYKGEIYTTVDKVSEIVCTVKIRQ